MSERFGGERFAVPGRMRETAHEELLGELEEAALEMSVDKSKLAREMAAKLLEIVEIKRIADQAFHRQHDTSTYQRIKPLGIFAVEDAVAKFDIKDPDNGFKLKKGERHLSLHLLPLREDEKNFRTVAQSAVWVAEYIDRQRLYDREQIVGVTFEMLASASRRLGFHSFEAPVPEEVGQRVSEIFSRHGRGKDMGRIMVVHQPIDDFVCRIERGSHHE